MLSSGKFHLHVPKDYLGNLRFRRKLWRLCHNSPGRQAAIRAACKADFLFWVNSFVYQYNPNTIGDGSREMGPFITWEFQDDAAREILHCIEYRHDLVIEKSREMGASWLCLLVMTWFLLFHDNKKFLCISRSEEAVDKVDESDSLFWKVDFILAHLPDWMTQKAVKRRRRSFRHRLNHSSITGQATTRKAGVGGRCTAMFMDELAQIDEAHEILARTRDTTACRIFNSTHLGEGTEFHKLTERPDIHKLVMHWSQHPDKWKGAYRYHADTNAIEVLDKGYRFPEDFQFVMAEEPAGGPYPCLRSVWYDLQCSRPGSHKQQIARDLDINPGGSVSQFYDALTIRQLVAKYCFEPLWEGDVEFDPETGRLLGLTRVKGGPLKLWLHPKDNERLPEGKYGLGCDLSEGNGATPSVATGTNATTGEKVLEYAVSHIKPERMAPLVMALGWLLKDAGGDPALLGWEDVGPGRTFGRKLIEFGYPRIYTRMSDMLRGGKRSKIPGWCPNQKTKLDLHGQYRAALGAAHFVNHHERALKETLAYSYAKNGQTITHPKWLEADDDPTGAGGNHGDRATADALSWLMCQQFGRVGQLAKEEEEKAQPGTLAWRRELAEAETKSKW